MGFTQDNKLSKYYKEVGTSLHVLWDCPFLQRGPEKTIRVAQTTSTRIYYLSIILLFYLKKCLNYYYLPSVK